MKPEEYLDHLIAQYHSNLDQYPLLDDEVAPCVSAVKLLMQMRDIPVPAEFAHRLEDKIRFQARMQHLAEQNGKFILPVHPQQRQFPRSRPWILAIGSVAALFIVFACLLTASFYGLPKRTTSDLQQTYEPVTPTSINNAQNSAEEAIGHLENALLNLNTVVSGKRDDKAITQAFNLVVTWTQNSQTAVAALPADSHFQGTRHHLAATLTEEKQRLSHLLNQVDWSMKVVFTHQLGSLGEAVPLVSHVVVQTVGNGVLKITLRGKNFVPPGQLTIDGTHMGSIGQFTNTQIVALVTHIWWTTDTHTIGLLCPDGTAAQIVYRAKNDGYERPGTPITTPTGGPGDE